VSTVTKYEPVRVAETDAHEGPVYVPGEHALYFTTPRPVVDIKRLDLETGETSVVRRDANAANGMALMPDGRLLVCEQDPPAISLVDPRTGRAKVLVDSWRGLSLNSPNDVVRKSDGTIWFTDPSYGHLQGFRPEPEVGDHVYRYDPDRVRLDKVAGSFHKPNGLAFSPMSPSSMSPTTVRRITSSSSTSSPAAVWARPGCSRSGRPSTPTA
jgi:gluconolactonase